MVITKILFGDRLSCQIVLGLISIQLTYLVLQLFFNQHVSPMYLSNLCFFLSIKFLYLNTLELQSRGEVCGGLEESVFKGVSTPNFCIIHITPQRWSISRLRQESWAISWRDAAPKDIRRLMLFTQEHIHEISYAPRAREEGGIFLLG